MSVDMKAVKARLAQFGEWTGTTPPETIVDEDGCPAQEILDFCKAERLSFDWLVCGDLRALVMTGRRSARQGVKVYPGIEDKLSATIHADTLSDLSWADLSLAQRAFNEMCNASKNEKLSDIAFNLHEAINEEMASRPIRSPEEALHKLLGAIYDQGHSSRWLDLTVSQATELMENAA